MRRSVEFKRKERKPVTHRFQVWPPALVRLLIAFQFIVPLLITGFLFSFGYSIQATSNGSISFVIASLGLVVRVSKGRTWSKCSFQVQKAINTSVMIIYSIITVILTFMSSRLLSELRGRIEVTSVRTHFDKITQ